jgi:hypothetical protein
MEKNKCLHFKVKIDEADSWNLFEKWVKATKFPPSLQLNEFDVLSIIRMSRKRNKELYEKIIGWYGKIDQKFRVI